MLDYFPIAGTVLLTIIIVWIGTSTIIANRRKIRSALAGDTYCVIPNGQALMPEARKSICCGAATFRPRWTADGWVAPCQCCGQWQYLGDDYEHPPEDAITDLDVRLSVEDRMTPALEVTSDFLHELGQSQGRRFDKLSSEFSDDEGEPLPASMSHQPNIGGEGNPDYEGPHYLVEHDRFVPYDVLRDPLPGAAVHIVGNTACVGPLKDESQGEEGHAESAEDDHRSD